MGGAPARALSALSRHYAKACDVRDFADPAFRERAASIRPDISLEWQFDRKTWEFTMLSLLLDELGLLDGRSELLSVGAGREWILFWLAPRVKRLVATDIYGRGEFAGNEAPETMLTDPASLSPYGEPINSLEVLDMDARELRFPSGSFDAVFCLSSIEHFGTPADIRGAAVEMGRVLRPGGVAYIATELSLSGSPRIREALRRPLRRLSGGRLLRRELFTAEELRRDVIEASGLNLMQRLDTSISSESFDNLARRAPPRRRLVTPSGHFHPHITLRLRGETFTSVGLPLRKPSPQ